MLSSKICETSCLFFHPYIHAVWVKFQQNEINISRVGVLIQVKFIQFPINCIIVCSWCIFSHCHQTQHPSLEFQSEICINEHKAQLVKVEFIQFTYYYQLSNCQRLFRKQLSLNTTPHNAPTANKLYSSKHMCVNACTHQRTCTVYADSPLGVINYHMLLSFINSKWILYH